MHWGDRQVTTTTESSAPKKREMESLKESLNPKGQGWKFLYEVSRPGNSPPWLLSLPPGLLVSPSKLLVFPSKLVATPRSSFLFHKGSTL